MDDSALAAYLNAGIRQASGYTESRLAKERERAIRFYQGEHPLPIAGSNSKYVSMDVYEGVEQMKAQLLEVFSGNTQPASFAPIGPQDVLPSQIATDYVNNVIFQQNPGFQIFETVIDDGLMGRAGICKVWWNEDIENEEYEMSDAALSDLQAYLGSNPEAEIDEIEIDEDGETIKRVTILNKVDRSKVRIEPLPPEEFLISGQSKNIREANLVVHRQPKTASELLKMGYKKSVIAKLQDQDQSWLSTEPELVLRFQQTDDIIGMRNDENQQQAKRIILVSECYTEVDLEDTGRAELWKIVIAGDTILEKKRVSRKPFVAFVPLPRPHAFWGTNYARLLIPTQSAKTYLTRSIIDHTLITNNPRYMVVRGAVKNVRELMENRIGGIVNVDRPDGLAPLPQASLNPFVFQTISMLEQNREELTGISGLSQGLNKDAISKQNSAQMVNDLISVSQIRQKIIARNFAEGFLTDLYRMAYELVCENENRKKVIQIAGQWAEIDPTDWPAREFIEIDFALGYGENDKEAAKWLGIDQSLAADPRLAPQYTPEQRYAVISKILRYKGVRDIGNYFLNPAQAKPTPPDPMHMAEVALKQADAQSKQAAAQATAQKMQLDAQNVQLKMQLELKKIELEQMKIMQQFEIEKMKLAHQVSVDAAELKLQQQAQQTGKLEAVAEPK